MITTAEVSRKLIHLINLIIPFGYLYIVPDKFDMMLLMTIIASFFLYIDLSRNKIKFIGKIFDRSFAFMLRDHEKKGRLTGATWVVMVAIPVIYIFPKEIAVLSMIFMSVGDIAAGLIGRSFGKTRIGKKSLEGSVGCLIVCAIAGILMNVVPIPVALIGAVFATIFEVLPIDIDDNVLIPLGSGTAMAMASTFI